MLVLNNLNLYYRDFRIGQASKIIVTDNKSGELQDFLFNKKLLNQLNLNINDFLNGVTFFGLSLSGQTVYFTQSSRVNQGFFVNCQIVSDPEISSETDEAFYINSAVIDFSEDQEYHI